jgi:hypothetical protein
MIGIISPLNLGRWKENLTKFNQEEGR